MKKPIITMLCVVIFLLLHFTQAAAVVYKWVDERGVVHFADALDKVPPAYRNSVEEAKTPKMPIHPFFQAPPEKTVVNTQSGKASTQAPSIAQTLVREGDFAMKLADRLKIGTAQSDAQAESMLASSGIAPKNGWIADYPVTPDIIGELQNAVSGAVDSGKLAVNKDEAIKAFQDLIAQQGLPVGAETESQYPGVEQPYAGEAPPQNYPEYYEPSVIDDYYNEQGPPVVTYYPPPPDYGYFLTFAFLWGRY